MMTEYRYGIKQESREEYKDRLARASGALVRTFMENPAITPLHFEVIETEYGVDSQDISAELGELHRAGVIRHQGLGYAVDEQALAGYVPAQGW